MSGIEEYRIDLEMGHTYFMEGSYFQALESLKEAEKSLQGEEDRVLLLMTHSQMALC